MNDLCLFGIVFVSGGSFFVNIFNAYISDDIRLKALYATLAIVMACFAWSVW